MHLLEQDILMTLIKSNYLTNTGILKSRKEKISQQFTEHQSPVVCKFEVGAHTQMPP